MAERKKIKNLRDLHKRIRDEFSDVEVFEKKLDSDSYIVIFKSNSKERIDEAIDVYFDDDEDIQYFQNFNIYVAVVIINIEKLTNWRKLSEPKINNNEQN